jgi:hypothetical protein
LTISPILLLNFYITITTFFSSWTAQVLPPWKAAYGTQREF